MPGPSAAILTNTVSVYAFVPQYDADASVDGTQNNYPTLTATIQCSIQPKDVEQRLDEHNRMTAVRHWDIMTDLANAKLIPALKTKDRVVWVDTLGVTHNITVDGPFTDQAGRGVAFRTHGVENL